MKRGRKISKVVHIQKLLLEYIKDMTNPKTGLEKLLDYCDLVELAINDLRTYLEDILEEEEHEEHTD